MVLQSPTHSRVTLGRLRYGKIFEKFCGVYVVLHLHYKANKLISTYVVLFSDQKTASSLHFGWILQRRKNCFFSYIFFAQRNHNFSSIMARNFGHFRTETSCGLHEGFIYTAGIHGKVRADPTN